MADISHAVDRFLLHFGWTAWLVPGVFFILQLLIRKKWKGIDRWLPDGWRAQLLLCSVLVGLVPCLREPIDTWMGWQPGWKAITDCISWIAPALFAGWGTYRILVRGAQLGAADKTS